MGGTGLAMCLDNNNCCKKLVKFYLIQTNNSPICGSCFFSFPPNNPNYTPGYEIYFSVKVFDNNSTNGAYRDFSVQRIPFTDVKYNVNNIPYVEVWVPEIISFIVTAQIKEPKPSLCCNSCNLCNLPGSGDCVYPFWNCEANFDNSVHNRVEFELAFPIEPQKCVIE